MRSGGYLKRLSVAGWRNIDDDTMCDLILRCPNIVELNLAKCMTSDITYTAICNTYYNLRRLYLISCKKITDTALKNIATSCPLLTHIDLSLCLDFTDDGIAAFAQGCLKLRSFVSKGCYQLGDTSLMSFARYCRDLEELDLTQCEVLISLTP